MIYDNILWHIIISVSDILSLYIFLPNLNSKINLYKQILLVGVCCLVRTLLSSADVTEVIENAQCDHF